MLVIFSKDWKILLSNQPQSNNVKQEVKELKQEIHQIILSHFEEQSDSENGEK